jgi:signal transduction histidine kinase
VADGLLRLTVQDDGGAIEPVRPGFGLQSLDERAAELGGRTDVRTEDDGVEVTATVPVPESRS